MFRHNLIFSPRISRFLSVRQQSNIALFIDGDQIPIRSFPTILNQLKQQGTISTAKIFAAENDITSWKDSLEEFEVKTLAKSFFVSNS